MLFYSNYRERTQFLQIEAMQERIANAETPEERQRLEFELGLYYERNRMHDAAFHMFNRVSAGYPYPDIHYGYLHDEAVWKMGEYSQRGWVGDTPGR